MNRDTLAPRGDHKLPNSPAQLSDSTLYPGRDSAPPAGVHRQLAGPDDGGVGTRGQADEGFEAAEFGAEQVPNAIRSMTVKVVQKMHK